MRSIATQTDKLPRVQGGEGAWFREQGYRLGTGQWGYSSRPEYTPEQMAAFFPQAIEEERRVKAATAAVTPFVEAMIHRGSPESVPLWGTVRSRWTRGGLRKVPVCQGWIMASKATVSTVGDSEVTWDDLYVLSSSARWHQARCIDGVLHDTLAHDVLQVDLDRLREMFPPHWTQVWQTMRWFDERYRLGLRL